MFETIYTETVFEIVAMAKAYVLEDASYMSEYLRETLINPKAVDLFWQLVEEFENAKQVGYAAGFADGHSKA